MALNITKFEGTVAIEKSNYKFSCNGTGLIFDVDHSGAMAILNSLTSSTTHDSETVPVAEAIVTTTPEPKVEAKTLVPSGSYIEPASTEECAEREAVPAKKAAPKKRGRRKKQEVVTDIPAVTEEQAASGVAEQEEPPEELKKARQLKGIVSYFVDLGFTDADAITQQCEKYKASVPMLSAASDLKTRIERVLVLLGVNDGE